MTWRTDAITSFSGQHHFLSNFFTESDGTHVEGEYQARKTLPISFDVEEMAPGDAKRAGRKLPLRPDWGQVKLQIMDELVMAKFIDHPDLRKKLLATEEAELVECNFWHDDFWGVCMCPTHCLTRRGKNHLGLTLMGVRDWLR